VETVAGHAFISYVREDSHDVDKLQQTLAAAGIPVWRDTADLWPGQDWRIMIRNAITKNALVFIACFSSRSIAREKSYQNEELLLAIEQLRLRHPDVPWLIPVRFDACDIPDLEIGGGRTLASIQRADLFSEGREAGIARLVMTILRILGLPADLAATQSAPTSKGEEHSSSATKNPLVRSGRNSKVLEISLDHGDYRMSWTTKGQGYFGVIRETGSGRGTHLVSAVAPDTDSGEVIVRIAESGHQIFSIDANGLDWTLDFTLL
jgi:hypothetical protein